MLTYRQRFRVEPSAPCGVCRDRAWTRDGAEWTCRTCRRIVRSLRTRRHRRRNGDGDRASADVPLEDRIRHERRVRLYAQAARELGLQAWNAEEPHVPCSGLLAAVPLDAMP
mgnify:CR=1 FL=1